MTSSNKPLMPKATCVWLIDNTTLTFEQIAVFCGIHEIEVKAIADEVIAVGIKGFDPISSGQLTKIEIERCSKDPSARLQLNINKIDILLPKKKKNIRINIPLIRRQHKPDAIYWLLKNCPELQDNHIIKLIGTNKVTITTIRERTHSNMQNIKPRDPVFLRLTTQSELDRIRAQAKLLVKEKSDIP